MAVTTRGGASSGDSTRAQQPPAPVNPEPNPPEQPQPNPPEPIVAFARTPAQSTTGIIDYSTRMGERLYQLATAKLDEETYDGSAEGLFPVIELIKERARKFGWDRGIMMIPDPRGGPNKYLLDHYGSITIDSIRDHESTYIARPNRQTQDTYLLYECVMNSLSPEAKSKVNILRNEFLVDGHPSGNLLVKVVIRECHLDTNATIASIRQRLASLDTYLPTIDYDIGKLNMYVKTLLDQLAARGETSTDMLSNLFTGYLSAKDRAFVSYIDKKLELYEEGTDISYNQLMLWARQKYDLLRDKGVWNAPTPEEEKILALTAQVNKMSEKLKAKKPERKDNPVGQRGRTKDLKPKPDWFSKEPEDPTKTIVWNNKEWHWCGAKTGGKCEGFVRHKPSDCRGKKRKSTQKGNDDKRHRVEEALAQEAVGYSSERSDPYLSS